MEEKTETITIKKDTMWKVATAILGVALIVVLFMMFGGNGNGNSVKNPGNNLPSINMESLIDDDAVRGDEDAPITVVEFSDYECPFCARFYQQTLGSIESNYIDSGKVKFIYRDFPLSFHPQAQKAAEAAECAGEQGKYFEMHDKLFTDGVSGGVASFKRYAADLGLDTAEFNSCLDSGEMASEVQKDMSDGQKVGIQGTPGFIINGKEISGACPYATFSTAFDAELNGDDWSVESCQVIM